MGWRSITQINHEPNPKAQDLFSCGFFLFVFFYFFYYFFLLCKQGFSWFSVRRCEYECVVGQKKSVCMQIQCSIPFLNLLFGAEVMYCIEINIPYFFIPTFQIQMIM